MLTVSNFSTQPFHGWVRAAVPDSTEGEAASVPADNGSNYLVVFGEKVGQSRSAWIKISDDKELPPNAALMLDMDKATPMGAPEPAPMVREVAYNPVKAFAPTINGVPMVAVFHPSSGEWLRQDGVALKGHFRARVTETVWADLWVTWVPSESWFRWELLLNSASPQYGHVITEEFSSGFDLRIGNALLGCYGGKFGALMENESIAQGQARAFAGVGGFEHLMTDDERRMTLSMLTGSPVAVDDRFYATLAGLGVPKAQDGFNAQSWAATKLGAAFDAMHSWNQAPVGVSPNSGRTGAQEEQVFAAHGAECFAGGVAGGACAFIRYLTALTYSRRPCHWREEDGRMLDYEKRDLVFWGGRPHWHHSVSPNQLGLERAPTIQETHGWMGPDREHWFYGSLFTAAILTGSDVCQWLLEAQARIVHYQETVDPSLSTSGPDAARSVGWFGIMVKGLGTCLRDDWTLHMLNERAKDRLEQVYIPSLDRQGKWAIWDIRADNRLLQSWRHNFTNITVVDGEGNESTVPGPVYQLPHGATVYTTNYEFEKAWMPYQQAVGAFGLYLLGQLYSNGDAIRIAQHAADTVVQLGYQADSMGQGGLQTWATLPLKPGTEEPIEPEDYRDALQPGTSPLSWFRHAWMPLALWVRTQTLQGGGDPEAQKWWDLTWEEHRSGNGVMAWMPPLERTEAPA